MLAVAAIAVMAAGVLQPYLPAWSGGEPTAAEASAGGITVERVTNNYTQPARVYVSPVDDRSLVDRFAPFLVPGESAGPASLDCGSVYGIATHLRLLIRPTTRATRSRTGGSNPSPATASRVGVQALTSPSPRSGY